MDSVVWAMLLLSLGTTIVSSLVLCEEDSEVKLPTTPMAAEGRVLPMAVATVVVRTIRLLPTLPMLELYVVIGENGSTFRPRVFKFVRQC